jgi:hypothetical protein
MIDVGDLKDLFYLCEEKVLVLTILLSISFQQ